LGFAEQVYRADVLDVGQPTVSEGNEEIHAQCKCHSLVQQRLINTYTTAAAATTTTTTTSI